jgi:hypothetical protein
MLCDKCSNIHFRRLQKCDLPEYRLPEEYRDRSHDQGSSVYYFHHEDKWALEASADNGCHFCGMIWGRLFASPARLRSSPESSAGKQVYLRRTWSEKWIENEGSDALERSEYLVAYCEDRFTYSSNMLHFRGQYKSDTEVTTK